jgi:hypothetical protein
MRGARRVLLGLGILWQGFAAQSPAARAETPPASAGTPAPETPAAPPGAATAPPAGATPPAAGAARPRQKTFARLAPPTLSHDQQFGLALLPGTGYRAIFPYQENINCGQLNHRVCTGRLPWFLDVQPSFGFARRWDVLLDLRFGLEQDFTTTHQFAVAPGVRYWVDPEDNVKFFATIQVAYDTTPQHSSAALTHNDDVAVRNSNGFMFEVMRNFGVYLQFGETIGFVRWLRFEIDGGVGVQARLP